MENTENIIRVLLKHDHIMFAIWADYKPTMNKLEPDNRETINKIWL